MFREGSLRNEQNKNIFFSLPPPCSKVQKGGRKPLFFFYICTGDAASSAKLMKEHGRTETL